MPGERVGFVLAGGGARGAYEMGAMSVLLPALQKRHELPSVIVGTSVGALNATFLAANAQSPAEATVEKGCEIWRGLRWEDVVQPVWSPRTLVPALRYSAGLFSRRIRVEYLLDSRPLVRTLSEIFPIDHVVTRGSHLHVQAQREAVLTAVAEYTRAFRSSSPSTSATRIRST